MKIKQKPSIKAAIILIATSIFVVVVISYAASLYRLGEHSTKAMIEMMFDQQGKNANVFFPPYAYEAHYYLFRGDKESVEAVKSMGGITVFFKPYGPNTRPEMRKRIAKFYLGKGIDINDGYATNQTPLLFATITNQPEAIKWMLSNGADPNMKHPLFMGSLAEQPLVNALEQAQHLSKMYKDDSTLLAEKEALLKHMYKKDVLAEKERTEGEKALSNIYSETVKILKKHTNPSNIPVEQRNPNSILREHIDNNS